MRNGGRNLGLMRLLRESYFLKDDLVVLGSWRAVSGGDRGKGYGPQEEQRSGRMRRRVHCREIKC